MPAIPVLGRIGRRLLGALAIQALAAFAALTAILWLVGALSRIDLVTDRGQTLLTFLAITALALPALAVVLAPIAVFLASIFLLWKLAGDSEIAAMAAAGGSPRRLATPFLAFAALVALAGGYVANSVAPAAARVTTTMLAQVGADFLSRVLAPGAFSSFEDGLTLHFRARAADGSLVGVFIDDARDPARRMTYVAKAGRTAKSAGHDFLLLSGGTAQSVAPDGATAFLSFDSYEIDLGRFEAKATALPPVALPTATLMAPPAGVAPALADSYFAEWTARFTAPLYALAAAAIALAAFSRPRTNRAAREWSVGFAALAFLAVRIGGLGAQNLVAAHPAAAALAWGAPLGATAAALAYAWRDMVPRRASLVAGRVAA